MDSFGSTVYPQSRQTFPQTPFRFNDYKMCKDPIPIEHFWLMQMLGNLEAKRNFTILYFLSPPCPKIASASLRGLIFIDAANKFSNFQKEIGTLLAT